MSSPFVVLVEGPDDQEVCRHVLRQHDMSAIVVEKSQGYSSLLDAIPAWLNTDIEALAIVVDADVDLNARWQSLRDTLRRLGYTTCPNSPNAEGTIVSEIDKPLVGVWIMPDNLIAGILEDFAATLVPANDLLWHRALQCVDAIPTEHRPFSSLDLPKVRIHTWLAWQEEPGKQMGAAIGRRYLDSQAIQAVRFVSWIRRMLEQKPTFNTRPDVLA